MKRRVGVLMCGCGAYDGTDPHEAVLALLAIQVAGHSAVPLALEAPQFHVVDHTSAQECEGETRSQFAESARLCRDKLYKLDEISPKLLDALIIPGGQGSAKNLISGASGSEAARVIPPVAEFVCAVHAHGGVIGAISLSEFVLSGLFGPFAGGKGCFDLGPEEVLADPERRLYLTPGSTLAKNLPELQRGVESLVAAVLGRVEEGEG